MAVLLTYNGVVDLQQWRRFVAFVRENIQPWGVKYWCATLEANKKQWGIGAEGGAASHPPGPWACSACSMRRTSYVSTQYPSTNEQGRSV